MDRCLSIIEVQSGSCLYAHQRDFPARPMIGLLVRLIYQQYSQEMDAVLRRGRVRGHRSDAGNVFPFVTPEGITVSELAELAQVRKQTMAQAVEPARANRLCRAEAKPE